MPKHIPRLFISPTAFGKDRVVISHREHHHQLTRVLRMRPGDHLVVLDGKGKEYAVKIMDISKREVVCRYTDESLAYPNGREAVGEPRVLIRLFQAIPKQLSKFEEVLRHGTEVGISEFYPLITEHVEGGEGGRELCKRERMEHILKEAAEQSERGKIPVLGPEIDFSEVLKNEWPKGAGGQGPSAGAPGLEAEVTLMASEREQKVFLWDVVQKLQGKKSINLVVGPEGGFSEEEIEQAKRRADFTLFGLGPRILRTETAGVAVASALLFGTSLGKT